MRGRIDLRLTQLVVDEQLYLAVGAFCNEARVWIKVAGKLVRQVGVPELFVCISGCVDLNVGLSCILRVSGDGSRASAGKRWEPEVDIRLEW